MDVEFTEAGYRELVRLAKDTYTFASFRDYRDTPPRSVLWRHDIDFSVHRALALAEIEAEEGVHATYFVYLHSSFYNAFEAEIAVRVRAILEAGHELGLHFDPTFYNGRKLEVMLERERDILADLFEHDVDVFSIHNPTLLGWDDRRDEIAGMTNAYGAYLAENYGYVSDSHGRWRFEPLDEVLRSREHERLHVLTHPAWWVPEPAEPRERVTRAIEGRARHVEARYDKITESMRLKSGR